MFFYRSCLIVATVLGLAWSQPADNLTAAGETGENTSANNTEAIVETVNRLTQLNATYPVGRKINFSSNVSTTQSEEPALRVKFPPRRLKTRPVVSPNRPRNDTSRKYNLNHLTKLHPLLARKLNTTRGVESANSSKVLENRSEVDSTVNELIGEKLARLEKLLVSELMMTYKNISGKAKLQKTKGNQNVTIKQPFRIVVPPNNAVGRSERPIKRRKIIFGKPQNTTHVMRITKNNIDEKEIKNINETEITQAFQDFGRKITQKRESVENDLEAIESLSKFKPPDAYLSGFRPIVRRDLSIIGPIPRGFGGMRSLDSTYDGIRSGDIPPPPMWPAPPFSMGMSAVEQPLQPPPPQQRVKIDESPSLELLLFKYEEALKQYQEAVTSYKKYYDKYLLYNERIN